MRPTAIVRILLLLLVVLPLTTVSDTTSSTKKQAPIRTYGYTIPVNNPTGKTPNDNPTAGSNCATGKCPEERRPTSRTLSPKSTDPKAITPAHAPNKLQRPISKFIPPLPTSNDTAHEPQQLLLYFAERSIADKRIREINQKHQLKPIKRTPLNALGGEIVLYVSEQYDLTELRKMFSATAPEAVIELNFYYYAADGPRQYFSSQIRLQQPPTLSATIPIGIIDTGVADIPALSTSKKVQKSFLSSANKASNTSHGTAVALLIAGVDQKNNFYGVVPGSPLYIANIMRKTGNRNNTNSLMLAQAIDWLVGQKVTIINLSLGGPNDTIMASLFKKLKPLSVFIISAAGNGGPKAPPSYPAAYSSVIAVTATNGNNQVYKQANRGSYIDIAAPGEDVWVPISIKGQYVSGTSFSAALVSGATSRLLIKNPTLTLFDIQQMLCKETLDLGKAGKDNTFGCGLIQIKETDALIH